MDIYDLVNGKVRCTAVKDNYPDFTVGRIYEVKDKCVICNDGFEYKPGGCKNGIEWLIPYDEFELVENYDHPKGIKQVIFNDPATIILWHDGTKTVAKCLDGDEYDAEKGFCIAYLEKMIGAKQFSEELHKWVKDEEKPKYFNGKMVCVKSPYRWWTVGKTYDVVDGIITANDGDKYPKGGERYVDADDARHAGSSESLKHNSMNTFVPLEEYKPYKTKPPFKVGDKVKIVNHSNWWWVDDMEQYKGKIMTIKEVESTEDQGEFILEEAHHDYGYWHWGGEDFARD